MQRAKIAAVLVAIAIGVLAWRLGILDLVGDPAGVKRALVELGAWGYVAFLVMFALLNPLGIPGTVFILASALIWPWPVAFTLSMIGSTGASIVGFSFARFVARDWVKKIVPARFHAYDDALAKRAFVTVFGLRTVFWMSPLLHVFLGVSKVRFSTHLWASVTGYLLPLLVTCYFGQRAFDWLRDAPLSVWLGVGAGAVVISAMIWASRRRASKVLSS